MRVNSNARRGKSPRVLQPFSTLTHNDGAADLSLEVCPVPHEEIHVVSRAQVEVVKPRSCVFPGGNPGPWRSVAVPGLRQLLHVHVASGKRRNDSSSSSPKRPNSGCTPPLREFRTFATRLPSPTPVIISCCLNTNFNNTLALFWLVRGGGMDRFWELTQGLKSPATFSFLIRGSQGGVTRGRPDTALTRR